MSDSFQARSTLGAEDCDAVLPHPPSATARVARGATTMRCMGQSLWSSRRRAPHRGQREAVQRAPCPRARADDRLWDSRAMPEDHFGERVAERYDEWDAASFRPAVVDPVVDFVAALAGEGAALEL